MKVGDRLVSFLNAVILIFVSIVFFLIVIGQAGFIIDYLNNLQTGRELIWIWSISFITLLLGFLSLAMALQRRREEPTITHDTQFGEVQITVSAIESLALRSTKQVKGVKDAHVGIRAGKNELNVLLDVFIEITVFPDLSVPKISEEIRTKVNDYILETVGIKANSIQVFVTKVAGEISRTRVE
ncbi:MAG TPA: alkaline shock response membrane anchor protein AmaP [Bacillota bacterium]|jgi:uncharacterized alkaline shock family protein YloU|nr:alkaline shock response membrane anchor protein AmaP [Bacillota bacterium]HOL08736.1 alkaline shock response membrane anchor protein AmaP [Bacillota bacterium]HPO96361.1 alkaline shock response membrane anchor protein AmaP [Bacillota bacterium]